MSADSPVSGALIALSPPVAPMQPAITAFSSHRFQAMDWRVQKTGSRKQAGYPSYTLEDPKVVADAIGSCFDVILMRLRRGLSINSDYLHWGKQYADLDPRIQAGGPWAIVDDSTIPITLFGA